MKQIKSSKLKYGGVAEFNKIHRFSQKKIYRTKNEYKHITFSLSAG